MRGMGMASKVQRAVAGLTIAAASRTEWGNGASTSGGASGGIMAGGASVMHLIVGRIHRSGEGRTLDQGIRMTVNALRVIIDPSGVVGLDMADKVGAMAAITVTAIDWAVRGLSCGSVRHDR